MAYLETPACLETLNLADWTGAVDPEAQGKALKALEAGQVVALPHLAFAIEPGERVLLDPKINGEARKNVSYDSALGRLGNAELGDAEAAQLKAMMQRFAQSTTQFVQHLLPLYAKSLQIGRTSFRPTEIEGRATSPRHDDKRLHVDAFPSRPLQGRRLLRLFCNISPDQSPRHWRVGEAFPEAARRFLPQIKQPLPASAWLMQQVGVTKGRRSVYDHIMLNLHDRMKLDAKYQASAPRTEVAFASGGSWLCFTDQVLHAAMGGHGLLEQTFYLPVEAMQDPATSPLRVLQAMSGCALV